MVSFVSLPLPDGEPGLGRRDETRALFAFCRQTTAAREGSKNHSGILPGANSRSPRTAWHHPTKAYGPVRDSLLLSFGRIRWVTGREADDERMLLFRQRDWPWRMSRNRFSSKTLQSLLWCVRRKQWALVSGSGENFDLPGHQKSKKLITCRKQTEASDRNTSNSLLG